MATPAQPGPLQRFWDTFVNSAQNSPLGGGGLARAWFLAHGYSNDQINKAIQSNNADFAKKYQNAPVFQNVQGHPFNYVSPDNIGRATTSLLGHILGGVDPTYAIGGAGKGVVQRIAHQAVTQAGADVVRQKVNMNTGMQDHFDPKEVVQSAVQGAAFQGAAEGLRGAFAGGKAPTISDSTDISPYKGQANPKTGLPNEGEFTTARDAAQHIVNNKLGGTHDVVAHNDGSYSAVQTRGFTPDTVPEDSAPPSMSAEDITSAPEPAPAEKPAVPATQEAAPAPDGLPGNSSVPPMDPAVMARIMGDEQAAGAPPVIADHEIDTTDQNVAPPVIAEHEIDNSPAPVQEAAYYPANPTVMSDYTGVAVTPEHLNDNIAPPPAELPTSAPVAKPVQQIPTEYEPPVQTPEVAAEDGPRVIREHGPFQEHPVPDDEPAGTHALSYTAESGEKIKHIRMGIEPDGTAEISIDPFSTAKNRVGPAEIRRAMHGLMEMYPEIKRFGGYRRSGAGKGRVQEITPTAPPAPQSPLGRLMADQRGSFTPFGGGEPPKAANDSNVHSLADARQKKALNDFHQSLMEKVHDRAQLAKELAKKAHEEGLLPFNVGDRFTTAKSRELHQGPWKVIGHYVDPKDPNRYGYYVERGKEGVDYERGQMLVNDPKADADRIARGWEPYDRAADVSTWTKLGTKLKTVAKRLIDDERGSLGPGREYEDDEPTAADHDPVVHKLTTALNEMKPLRSVVGKAIREERSTRITEANKALHGMQGEAALHGALGALKGEMPKAVIPSIRKYFGQDEIDHLFNIVKNSNRVSGYDKINTMRALQKVLGHDYAEVPTDNELKLLGQVFPKDFIMALKDEPNFIESLAGHGANILGIPRAVKTIGDLGVAFRQASPLIGTKEYWTSFPEMFKGIASEKLWQASMDEIHSRDTYPAMKEAGLALTDLGHDLTQREEFAASKIAEKIPLVRRSERGFTGYLNTIRADTFDRLYHQAEDLGIDVTDPKYLKQLGDFVNTMSGRGSIGDFGDKASPFLAAAFFSPRLQWSRLKLLTNPFNPNFYKLPRQLQKEYLRGVISYGIYMMVVLGTMKNVWGATVQTNPESTDFARAVIGKTRFDPSGSFQPYVRTVAQLATGKKITATGNEVALGSKYGTPTKLDVVNSFVESKASPNVDFILNELRGQDFAHPKAITGQTMDWKAADMTNPVVDALIPMGLEAMMKAGDEYGYKSGIPYAAGIAETFGIGANTYADKQKSTSGKHKEFSTTSEFHSASEFGGKNKEF